MSAKRIHRGIAVVVLASVAVLVPAPAHATEVNNRIVKGWYRDFLQRGSIDAERDYGREHWVQRLDATGDRNAVLAEIVRSPDYVRRQITDSYRYASVVIDARTGNVLSAANADEMRHPASLTKMMTLYMLFEAMRAGRVELARAGFGHRPLDHPADPRGDQ